MPLGLEFSFIRSFQMLERVRLSISVFVNILVHKTGKTWNNEQETQILCKGDKREYADMKKEIATKEGVAKKLH